MSDRLHKVLAHAGIASRRAAERLILDGRVTVNGAIVSELGTKVDSDRDSIKVDGKRVAAPPAQKTWLAFHKPRGVVTSLSDPEGRRSVGDYLRGRRGRLYPVGRLDYDSEGLLLLTNDGTLARDLTHPGSEVEKTYLVKVRGVPDGEAIRKLERGIPLDGKRTAPARVRTVKRGDNAWIEVTITEGRNRQVRRMLHAVGHPVQRLRRMRYAGIDLGALPAGATRVLTVREVERLRRTSTSTPAGRSVSRRPRSS